GRVHHGGDSRHGSLDQFRRHVVDSVGGAVRDETETSGDREQHSGNEYGGEYTAARQLEERTCDRHSTRVEGGRPASVECGHPVVCSRIRGGGGRSEGARLTCVFGRVGGQRRPGRRDGRTKKSSSGLALAAYLYLD